MTLIEEPLIGDDPTPPAPTAEPVAKRVLLVWDAPNLDMGLGAILGGRPTAAHRPRFDALGRWLLARTAELSAGSPGSPAEPEATVFTNIAPGSAEVVRPWVEALRPHIAAPVDCMATPDLPLALVAALEVHGPWRVVAPPGAACSWRLQVLRDQPGDALPPPPPEGWVLQATVRRPTDRDELTVLWRRPAR